METLNRDHVAVAPISAVMSPVKRPACASITPLAAIKSRRLSRWALPDHARNAPAALSAAATASSTVAAADTLATPPVNGSRRSKVAPPTAATRSPLINSSSCIRASSVCRVVSALAAVRC
jgi:hypothetical protein